MVIAIKCGLCDQICTAEAKLEKTQTDEIKDIGRKLYEDHLETHVVEMMKWAEDGT